MSTLFIYYLIYFFLSDVTRPKKVRTIHAGPIPQNRTVFKPAGIPFNMLQVSNLTVEEFEAVRLVDLEMKSQVEAAELMEISQPTISRILTSGHMKIADAIVNGKALKIDGGDFKFIFRGFGCIGCKREWEVPEDDAHAPEACPYCKSQDIYSLKRERL
nr:DUF134 domain-containing protein [Candidatus Sigynarchaeota archaeon]